MLHIEKLDMNGKCLIRLADKHLEDDLNIKFEFHRVAIISEINKEKGFKIVVGNTYEHRPEDMKNPHYWKIYVELADRDVKSEDIIEKVVFDLGSVKKDLKGIYTQHPFHHYIWGSPAVSYVVPVHIYWKAPLGIPTTIFNYEIFLGATGRQISFVKQFDKYKLFLDI